MTKIWQLEEKSQLGVFGDNPGLSPVVLQLLYNRGFRSIAAAKEFIEGKLDENLSARFGVEGESVFYDPFLFRDMDAAAELIIKCIKEAKKIVVYGDYDADGVTSSVILLEVLRTLHADAEIYLPDRVSEGYGLNKPAIKRIAENGVKLIVTVDNGIRNKSEVEYAKSLGLDVIITDHHILPDKKEDLPQCLFIDPADESENYPFRFLAGVGVSFKLVCALLLKANLPAKQKKLISEKCLDLVAVGTIADMVSLLGENRLLVKKGLEIINEKKRLGLNELISVSKINVDKKLEAWNIGWQIGPRLNAASRLAHANSAFALLTTTEKAEAEELATELNERNISRQKITEEISSQVEEQIDKDNLPELIVGIAGPDQIWNEGVIGLVAGRIAEKYYRPTLVVTRLIEEVDFDAETKKIVPKKIGFKGSGRSIEGFNLIASIEECKELLDKYGGHPMACGFSVKGEANMMAFKEKLFGIAKERIDAQVLTPKLKIEAELNFSELNVDLAEDISKLAPFGQHNPQPRFVSYGLRLDDVILMGFESQHIKLRLSASDANGKTNYFWALAFGGAETYKGYQIGDMLDLVYYLEINSFNGRQEAQLKIVDMRKCE